MVGHYQNEIISIHYIYYSESNESFYEFCKDFREKILFYNANKENNQTLEEYDEDEGLDSEIYSHCRTPDYKGYRYSSPVRSSIHINNENEYNSYQNNTIIENNKNCFNDDIDSHEYENIILLKKKAFSHYKLVTEIIEDHLEKAGHPLFLVKQRFIKEFINHFSSKNSKKTNYKNKYQAMVSNVIEFIKVLQHVIAAFYGFWSTKSFLKSMCYFTQENLLQFLTSILFKNESLYEILFQNCAEENREIEEKIAKNSNLLNPFHPQTFGVSKQFCLNEKTINFFRGEEENINTFKLKELTEPQIDQIIERKITWDIQNYEDSNNSPNSLKSPLSLNEYMLGLQTSYQIEEKNEIFPHTTSKIQCKNFKKSLVDKTLILTENLKNYEKMKYPQLEFYKPFENNVLPYKESISNLKKISHLRSPIHKLKNILKTAVLIIENIKKFYQQYEKAFNEEINSDEIMSILIYICCKAQVINLYTHCSFVESFITNQILSSVAGYYLITLKASLEYISSGEMIEKNQKILKI